MKTSKRFFVSTMAAVCTFASVSSAYAREKGKEVSIGPLPMKAIYIPSTKEAAEKTASCMSAKLKVPNYIESEQPKLSADVYIPYFNNVNSVSWFYEIYGKVHNAEKNYYFRLTDKTSDISGTIAYRPFVAVSVANTKEELDLNHYPGNGKTTITIAGNKLNDLILSAFTEDHNKNKDKDLSDPDVSEAKSNYFEKGTDWNQLSAAAVIAEAVIPCNNRPRLRLVPNHSPR